MSPHLKRKKRNLIYPKALAKRRKRKRLIDRSTKVLNRLKIPFLLSLITGSR
jgi:hypothetical protein